MKRRILSLGEKIFTGIFAWIQDGLSLRLRGRGAAYGVAGLGSIGAAWGALKRSDGEGGSHLAQFGSGDDTIFADDFDHIASS
jgi:hypothetical protein